jgi:hypothetical protein
VFPVLDYSADDIVAGNISLWTLLDTLFGVYKTVHRSSSRERLQSKLRSRSVSPGGPRRRFQISRPENAQIETSKSVDPILAREAKAVSPAPADNVAPKTDPATLASIRSLEMTAQRKKVHERALERRQRESGMKKNDSVAVPPGSSASSGWSNSTAISPAGKNSSIPPVIRRTSVSSSERASSMVDHSAESRPKSALSAKDTVPVPIQASSKISHYWLPPALTDVEIEAARSVALPTISLLQQKSIRQWLFGLDIQLIDGEGGFYLNSVIQSAADVSLTPGFSHKDHVLQKQNRLAEPIALLEDRLRNGVILGELLYRLEPNAAVHARIPRLLHRNPKTLDHCKQNLDRTMWLFKLRRSPPLPHHYLCLVEEFLKGDVKVVWGLLWEIMQAYPYAALSLTNKPVVTSASNIAHQQVSIESAGVLKGKLLGTEEYVAPIRSMFNLNDHDAGVSDLVGAEALHQVAPSDRYNYSDPDLENPVEVHTLPYSAAQRRQLDISLIQWMSSNNILQNIVGSLGLPTTILSLEGYFKDGTLFCMVLEKILQLSLPAEWKKHPKTYAECVGNVKLVVDVLRKCQNMKSRYLFDGVEIDIVRGKWDCILGLLEDMHRYADNVHPHNDPQDCAVLGPSGIIEMFPAPYLGIQQPSSSPNVKNTSGIDQENENPFNNKNVIEPTSKPSMSNLMHDVGYSYEPKLSILNSVIKTEGTSLEGQPSSNSGLQHNSYSEDTVNHSRAEMQSFRNTDLFPSNVVSGTNVVDSLVPDSPPAAVPYEGGIKEPFPGISSFPYQQGQSSKSIVEFKSNIPLSKNKGSTLMAPHISSEQSKAAPNPASPQSVGNNFSTISEFDTDSLAPKSPKRQPENSYPTNSFSIKPVSSVNSQTVRGIVKWLTSLRIKVEVVEVGSSSESVAFADPMVFADGVILCKVIQRLERRSETLPGTTFSPRTATQRTQNVRRVLEWLAVHRKNMTLRSLACEDDVIQGDIARTVELLLAIRHAYATKRL